MLFTSSDLTIEAHVEIDGKPLNEYRPTCVRDPRYGVENGLCESLLECELGKTFRVTLKSPLGMIMMQPGLAVYLSVDGRSVSGSHWNMTPTISLDKMIASENGQTYSAELRFAELEKTDDLAEVEVKGAELDALCRIEVLIMRGTQGTVRPHDWKPIKPVGKVHEKALKLFFVCI
ncbi:uncharacterized protein MKK02DRAFT_40983 [Dioszegia hungarica]|uniref:DUF7918 domain-containing protein n=1 Tax=Dioszegia hungarica TaxID=4972 RepID=A0AA38H2Y7_9TREE|nr:uncharacterized protein MKK02DRAFT_40983 [Dioszegia hungarica]KAI9632676.1 hypothetical protein MKK02DRAFT_40983 [Dioszegia hungarica]